MSLEPNDEAWDDDFDIPDNEPLQLAARRVHAAPVEPSRVEQNSVETVEAPVTADAPPVPTDPLEPVEPVERVEDTLQQSDTVAVIGQGESTAEPVQTLSSEPMPSHASDLVPSTTEAPVITLAAASEDVAVEIQQETLNNNLPETSVSDLVAAELLESAHPSDQTASPCELAPIPDEAIVAEVDAVTIQPPAILPDDATELSSVAPATAMTDLAHMLQSDGSSQSLPEISLSVAPTDVDLHSLGSSTSNFADDFDFDDDSASVLSKAPVAHFLPDKDGSSASLDAFLDGAGSDVSRPSVPPAFRRVVYSPVPSHGTAASNFDADFDDPFADIEFPKSFGLEGPTPLIPKILAANSTESSPPPRPVPVPDEMDGFDDMDIPEDAFSRLVQSRPQVSAAPLFDNERPGTVPSLQAPAPLANHMQAQQHVISEPVIAVTAVPVHEVCELDDIDDLVVSVEKEAKYQVTPRMSSLDKRTKPDTSRSNTFTRSRIEGRSSLTAPTASFLAKMKEPVKMSHTKNKTKTPKRPELIQNLGSANTVKVIGEMRWNPELQKWEGNEDVLRDFDPPPPPLRPALITNFGANARTPQTVGNMVWDPVTMSWRGNEDDGLVFDGFDDEDDNKSMISVATGLTGVAGTRIFEVSSATRQGFLAAERDHVISTSRWYPQRQGHIPSLGSQRLATRSHLQEIRLLVPND